MALLAFKDAQLERRYCRDMAQRTFSQLDGSLFYGFVFFNILCEATHVIVTQGRGQPAAAQAQAQLPRARTACLVLCTSHATHAPSWHACA